MGIGLPKRLVKGDLCRARCKTANQIRQVHPDEERSLGQFSRNPQGRSFFGSRFVARSSQTTAGMVVGRRLEGAKNLVRRTVSYFGNTILV